MVKYSYTSVKRVSWREMHTLTLELCDQLQALNPDGRSIGWQDYRLVTISRGGLIPAVIVSHWLGIPLNLILKPEELAHRKEAVADDSADLIVIDDICDKGMTFYLVRQLFPNAWLCCLYGKPEGRKLWNFCAEEVPQDVWVKWPWETEV